MAQTPEGRVKDAIKAVLDSLGAHYRMPVQGPYGKQGALDFSPVILHGLAGCIEAKAVGKFNDTTVHQDDEIQDIIKAGGVAIVIDTTDREEIRRLILDCFVTGRSVYPIKAGPSAHVRRSGRAGSDALAPPTYRTDPNQLAMEPLWDGVG